MFEFFINTTQVKRDAYILEVLLYRYLRAYIQKKEFDISVLESHWCNIILSGFRMLDLKTHYQNISGTTYGKILFEKCDMSLMKYFELIEETKGRI